MNPPNAKYPLGRFCSRFLRGEVEIEPFKKDLSARSQEAAKRSRRDEDVADVAGI
jgi:hypothetical protein